MASFILTIFQKIHFSQFNLIFDGPEIHFWISWSELERRASSANRQKSGLNNTVYRMITFPNRDRPGGESLKSKVIFPRTRDTVTRMDLTNLNVGVLSEKNPLCMI